jgi:L-2-hydroxyglutarate oxidase LhgO
MRRVCTRRLYRKIWWVYRSTWCLSFISRRVTTSISQDRPFNRLVYPIANTEGLGIHVTLDLSERARLGPDVQWIEEVGYSFDSSRRTAFVEAIRLYYPELDELRLQPAYVGIRPKIAGKDQGFADFCIRGPAEHGAPYVALCGIESPGLTASLALADHVLQLVLISKPELSEIT